MNLIPSCVKRHDVTLLLEHLDRHRIGLDGRSGVCLMFSQLQATQSQVPSQGRVGDLLCNDGAAESSVPSYGSQYFNVLHTLSDSPTFCKECICISLPCRVDQNCEHTSHPEYPMASKQKAKVI